MKLRMTVSRLCIRPSDQFRWQLLFLLPWLIPVGSYLLLGPYYLSSWTVFLGATALNAGLAVSCQWLLDQLTQRVTARYPGLHQSSQRLVLLSTVFMVFTPLFVTLVICCYAYFHWFNYSLRSDLLPTILLTNVLANSVSVGIFESMYSMAKWRENMAEKEELRKANLQSQYESLKQQVNPHFLFNTLNTLSSLISDAPRQAEQFLDQMARVYRYLLQTNRDTTDPSGELTTLATELDFIQSYFHLLKTRHGAGIEMSVVVTTAHQASLLPPLTLQMLVENAVKHNIIQATRPLRIEIKSLPDGYLLVRNNLQRKVARHDHLSMNSQVGLANIQAKYRLLTQQQRFYTPVTSGTITIDKSDTHFNLLLPLFNPTPQ
jgi:sensor histidine kinase YesM